MKFVKSFLSTLISAQLVLLPTVLPGFSSRAMAQVPDPDSQRLLKVADFVERADLDRLPTGRADTFQLVDQSATIQRRGDVAQTYDLGRFDLSIPVVTVVDFERDVVVAYEADGSLSLVHKGKKLEARHNFKSLKAVTFARDKELLVVVDTRGRLHAIDIGYARLMAFTSPIPVVPLVHSRLTPEELAQIKSTFITRGTKPMKRSPETRHVFPVDHEILTAGDLALYTENAAGERTQLGEFDRDVIRTQLYTAESVLALAAFSVSPPDDAAKVISKFAETNAKVEESDKRAADISEESPAAREALMSVSVERLLARAQANRETRPRDRFTESEWADSASLLIERAKSVSGHSESEKELREAAAQGDLGPAWQEMARRAAKTSSDEWADPRPLWYRMLSSKSVRILAAISAGSAASLGLAANTAWGIQILNHLADAYWPEVLKDTVYRVTLLKSSLALLSFVPLTYVIGLLAAAKTKWSPIKALASQTIKIYAEISLPFWHRLSDLTRQPNLMRALAQGVSPVKPVFADSAVGQRIGLKDDVRPGLSNPFAAKDERQRQDSESAKVLSALAQQRTRVSALAWLMALQAASHEAGVDPATFAALTGRNGEAYSKETLEKLASNPKFKEEWARLATELQIEYGKITRGTYVEDLASIDIQELNEFYKVALLKAKEIKSRDIMGRVLAGLRNRWVNFGSSLAKGFATFGKSEYEFLRNVVPNDFVVSQFWKQFVVDYWLSVVQIGVVGDRANLHDPHALAASENAFLWTTPGHRFDMVDQIRIYVLSVPATFALNYQDPAQVKETAYDPVESISMAGRSSQQSFLRSTKTWFKLAFDPQKADQYGEIAIRGFVRGIKTTQYSLLMNLVGRVLAAGQSICPAFAAFLYGTIYGKWVYGFPWDPVNLGNQRYDVLFEERQSEITTARGKVAQGLRLDDASLLKEGYSEITKLYTDGDQGTDKIFAELETSIQKLVNTDLSTLRLASESYREAVTELRRAIFDGSPKRLETARTRLETAYRSAGLEDTTGARAQLNSLSLLQYSLLNPPYETKANGFVTWATTLFGAFTTTYMATAMSVFTFQKNVPWVETLTKASIMSTGLYASYFYGTKYLAKWARGRAEARAKTAETQKFCHEAFGVSSSTSLPRASSQ